MPVVAQIKTCSKCNLEKSAQEFHKNKKAKSGLSAYCKACTRAYDKARGPARRKTQKYQEAKKRDYLKHHDARLAKLHEWRKHNKVNPTAPSQQPEYKRQVARNRWLNKRDQLLANMVAYEQRLREAEGSFTPKQWLTLCEQYNHCCAYCKKARRLTRHHVVPLAKGGTNWIDNILPACQSCNSRIGTKTIYPKDIPWIQE